MPNTSVAGELDEVFAFLAELGVIPRPVPTSLLDALETRVASAPVFVWTYGRRLHAIVGEPWLAHEVLHPRVHALGLPPSRDPRERRWCTSFLAEAAMLGDGMRVARVTQAAREAWRATTTRGRCEERIACFLEHYRPNAIRPLGQDLRNLGLDLTVIWAEGEPDERARELLATMIAGDATAADRYRRRIAQLVQRKAADGFVYPLVKEGTEGLDDATVLTDVVGMLLSRFLAGVGRLLLKDSIEGLDRVDQVLSNDPPWWIHVRETVHEFRLGTHRLPGGTRIFVPVRHLMRLRGTNLTSGRSNERESALALGIDLCPALDALLELVRDIVQRLMACGPLEPIPALVFFYGKGAAAVDPLGVHVRQSSASGPWKGEGIL